MVRPSSLHHPFERRDVLGHPFSTTGENEEKIRFDGVMKEGRRGKPLVSRWIRRGVPSLSSEEEGRVRTPF